MRRYVASAFLAAVLGLAPAAAGYAPALAQDFSITDTESGPGGNWTRKLAAWWDVHAWYPPDALAKQQDGTVKLHLVIHPDGEIWNVDVVQGSGSKSIDSAGVWAFHGGHLPPFPPGAPAAQAEVNLTLHYILQHRDPKIPFTIGNDPVQGTIVDTMMQQTCTGTVTPLWWVPYGPFKIQAIFYHQPDGTKWIRIYYNAKGPVSLPVTEVGKSASWQTPLERYGRWSMNVYYWVWPVGDNRISGTTVEPYGNVEMTCTWEPPMFAVLRPDPTR